VLTPAVSAAVDSQRFDPDFHHVVSGFSRTVTGPPEGGHYLQM